MITTHIVAFGLIVAHLACPALPQRLATTTIMSQTERPDFVRSTKPAILRSTLLPLIATTEKLTTRTLLRPDAPTSTITLPIPTSTTSVRLQPFILQTEMTLRSLSTNGATQNTASANTTASDYFLFTPIILQMALPFFMPKALTPPILIQIEGQTIETPAKIQTDSSRVTSSILTKSIKQLKTVFKVHTPPSPKWLASYPVEPYIVPVKPIPVTNNLSDQSNSSLKISRNSTSSVALFGLPAFCSYSAVETCSNIPLNQCNDCTMAGAGFFVLFLVVLGVAIICSNAIIIMLFVSGKSTFTGTYGKIKVSLAFADLLTGLLVFCVAIPNFSKTINSSPEELLKSTLASVGSPEASVGGVFFIFITTSSLYHLVLLAQQRLYAVKWPIKYKQQKEKAVYIGIAIVWTLALICAVVPLFFPNVFSFTYQHLIFLFSLTLSDVTSRAVGPLVGVVVVVYLIPYLIMSGFTLATAVFIRRYMKKGSEMRSSDAGKREIMVFRTMAIMQLGFTITMIPLLVIISTSYSGVFTPYTISAPYIVSFYLSMSNSLVNVLVYSAMDAKFRKSVRALFASRSKKESKAVTSSASKSRQTHKINEATDKQSGSQTSMESHHQVDTV